MLEAVVGHVGLGLRRINQLVGARQPLLDSAHVVFLVSTLRGEQAEPLFGGGDPSFPRAGCFDHCGESGAKVFQLHPGSHPASGRPRMLT